jgi:DNA excision repair protein ERCC-4
MSQVSETPAGLRSPQRVLVTADARERGSQLLQLLEQSPSFDLHIGRLRCGDYLIENQVTVERKRYDDFAVSLVDGRLFTQAAALSRLSRPIILVEGPREPAPAVHRNALKGALLSLATAWRLPVVFSRDATESAWILETLGRQSRADTTPELVRRGYRPKRLQSRRSFVLQSLPGVGPVLAGRLLERFGTVRGVIIAGERELAQVQGCGPKRAAAIAKVVA